MWLMYYIVEVFPFFYVQMYLQVPDHQVHNHIFSSMKQSTHSYLKGLHGYFIAVNTNTTPIWCQLCRCVLSQSGVTCVRSSWLGNSFKLGVKKRMIFIGRLQYRCEWDGSEDVSHDSSCKILRLYAQDHLLSRMYCTATKQTIHYFCVTISLSSQTISHFSGRWKIVDRLRSP